MNWHLKWEIVCKSIMERNVKGKEPQSFEFSQHYFILITSHRGLMNMHQKNKKSVKMTLAQLFRQWKSCIRCTTPCLHTASQRSADQWTHCIPRKGARKWQITNRLLSIPYPDTINTGNYIPCVSSSIHDSNWIIHKMLILWYVIVVWKTSCVVIMTHIWLRHSGMDSPGTPRIHHHTWVGPSLNHL